MEIEIFGKYERFQWDKGNSEKNWIHHKVKIIECEQVFFNKPIILSSDKEHSKFESRWFLLGRTDLDRCLFIVFTTRNEFIRVISARDMNKREREIYNEEVKKHTKI